MAIPVGSGGAFFPLAQPARALARAPQLAGDAASDPLDLAQVNGLASESAPDLKRPTYQPVLQTIRPPAQQPVSPETVKRAQEMLDRGDRGGAYLELYKEMGNEQLLIQAQITTYTGIWGAGALTGNNLARIHGGERYDIPLDEFSKNIAQATIDAVRKDLEQGGNGRISDDRLQEVDRQVWADKNMPELFPGNIQFFDFWNHDLKESFEAVFSQATWNVAGAAVRCLLPNTSLFGINRDGRNVSNLVGKRPSEFAGNENYTIYGTSKDRFITVLDKHTGFVEAFWDNRPRVGGVRLPQLPDRPLDPNSTEYRQRQELYSVLGANRHSRLA